MKIIYIIILIVVNLLLLLLFNSFFNTSGKKIADKEIFAMNYQIKYKNYYLNQTLFSCEMNKNYLNDLNKKFVIISNNENVKNCNYYSAIIKINEEQNENKK